MSRLNYNDPDYMARLERRRKKRRRKNIATLFVLVNIVIVLVLFFALGKFIISSITDGKGDSVQTINQTQTDDTKKEKKNKKRKPYEVKGGFNEYYCYEADKQSRYENYQSLHPELSIDEVVWRVNANLDKKFYEFDVPAGDINDPYIIVNKYYKVDGDQKPELTTFDGYSMTPATAEAYKKMKEDAQAEGYYFAITSAYRSVSYQEGLYNGYLTQDPKSVVDTYSARPGYSEHHTGMALDLTGSGGMSEFGKTKEYPWVRDNCHKYGFIIRYTEDNKWITGYKNEPWHIRYIGVEIATDMKEKGISSYEEYKVKFMDHQPEEIQLEEK